jgi:hypothetical protein
MGRHPQLQFLMLFGELVMHLLFVWPAKLVRWAWQRTRA